jgi:LuxR family quorum sensing-dependent transcriptional regulator
MTNAQIGLDFLSRCGAGRSIDSIVDDFQATVRQFGFDVSACGAWTGVGQQVMNRFYFVDWPAPFLDRYMARDLMARDPVVLSAKRRIAPFLWGELRPQWERTPQVAETLALADEYGFIDGYAVPIHGPAGYQGLVSLAAKVPVQLEPAELGALHLMALTVHERCRVAHGFGVLSRAVPALTDREAACIRWAADGKSDAAIGELMGISRATAHFHVESVKKKLGVKSRIQAVAILVLMGEI